LAREASEIQQNHGGRINLWEMLLHCPFSTSFATLMQACFLLQCPLVRLAQAWLPQKLNPHSQDKT
jgi:hypothetical protein